MKMYETCRFESKRGDEHIHELMRHVRLVHLRCPPAQPRHIDLHATFNFGKDCRTNEVTLLVGILGPWHIHGISMIHGEFISNKSMI